MKLFLTFNLYIFIMTAKASDYQNLLFGLFMIHQNPLIKNMLLIHQLLRMNT